MSESLKALVCFALMATSPCDAAAPSDLDPRWGQSGIVRLSGATVDSIQLLADATVLAAVSQQHLVHLTSNGGLDATFGLGGVIAAPVAGYQLRTFAVRPDGRIDVLWLQPQQQPGSLDEQCERLRARYTARGLLDSTFGNNGIDRYSQGCGLPSQMIVASDGQSYLREENASQYLYGNRIAHWDAADRSQPPIAGSGTSAGGNPGFLHIDAFTVDRNGAVVVAQLGEQVVPEIPTPTFIGRFIGDAPDPSFGVAGAVDTHQFGRILGLAIDSGNAVIAAGLGRVERLLPNGSGDPEFAAPLGYASIPLKRYGENYPDLIVPVGLLADRRIVIAATVAPGASSPSSTFRRVAIARLTPRGEPDLFFGGGGMASVSFDGGFAVSSIAIRPTGEILIAGDSIAALDNGKPVHQATIVQLRGGDLPMAHDLIERSAVEYFHAGYGHYFLTADPDESAALDLNPQGGWARTTRTFNVWDDADPLLKTVCRFWSNQTYAPKSSHFYTPYEDECQRVKQDPAWQLERNTFYLKLPQGAPGTRTCASDSQPLYRAFNNGLTGAPNHRYTIDPALLQEMIDAGWTMEGEAVTHVFACVPLQQ